MFTMFLKYFLIFFLNDQICWSHSVTFGEKLDPQIKPYLEDVGEPLILTPLIESGDAEKARNLSTVPPFLNSSIVSHSGYFTVNKTYNSNLFFWFFRKNGDNWQNASLLLWLQGGPGVSSLYGLFNENGPYVFTKPELQLRNISWTNDYNVLYIDQPVGTGFSFTNSTDGYIKTQAEVADHLYEALAQFFQLFPQLSENAFYITGESYAGKYIPAISYKIHNKKKANLTNINLKGLFMISPITDGLVNGLANFCFQAGVIDSATKDELEKMEKKIESFIHSRCWIFASLFAKILLGKIETGSNVNTYDYREYPTGFEAEEWDYAEFLRLPNVRMKIHVGNQAYFNLSEQVARDFTEDMVKSVKSCLEELLDNNYTIAFVGGQFDIRSAHPLVENFLENLDWRSAYDYRTDKVKNRFVVDGVDAGYYTTYPSLTNILIRDAGHAVPKDQPQATLTALKIFIND